MLVSLIFWSILLDLENMSHLFLAASCLFVCLLVVGSLSYILSQTLNSVPLVPGCRLFVCLFFWILWFVIQDWIMENRSHLLLPSVYLFVCLIDQISENWSHLLLVAGCKKTWVAQLLPRLRVQITEQRKISSSSHQHKFIQPTLAWEQLQRGFFQRCWMPNQPGYCSKENQPWYFSHEQFIEHENAEDVISW